MKKTTLLTVLSLAALLLSACGAAAAGSSSSSGSGARGSSAFRNRPLTPEAKLALGIIKLDGTPQAVNPTEAAKLLPLWQLLAQLLGSSSSAPQEVTAVMNQIQANMTPEQVKTIAGMQLTSADMFSVFQQAQTADPAGASSAGNGAGGGGGARFFFGGGGGIPGGGGFGGNRAGGATTNGTGSATSAAQAGQQFSNQVSLILVNQVVQLLQTRIKS